MVSTLRWFQPCLTLIFLLLPGREALAANCHDRPLNFEGRDLVLVDGDLLCGAGYYGVGSFIVPDGATVRLAQGEHGTWIAADYVDIYGTIDFRGQGLPGGAGCDKKMQMGGGKGEGGSGGQGGPAHEEWGGGGGGGGASGDVSGGRGGAGSLGAPAGDSGRTRRRDARSELIVGGSGGGGGACGAGVGDRGGAGGAGGGSIGLRAAVLRLHSSGQILVDGADGDSAKGGSGGGGGGGVGGRIVVFAEEEFLFAGRLSARGGNGGAGGWSDLGNRGGGGGGGGGGGQIDVWYMDCPSGFMSDFREVIEIDGGAGGRRPVADAYGENGKKGWDTCVPLRTVFPYPSVRLSPYPSEEGSSVELYFRPNWDNLNTRVEVDCGDGILRTLDEDSSFNEVRVDCFYDDNAPAGRPWYPKVNLSVYNRVNRYDDHGAVSHHPGELKLPYGASYVYNADVKNMPPVVQISAPSRVFEGESASFSLSIEDPSKADMAAGFDVIWDWGDDSDKAEFGVYEQNKTYVNSGNYVVSVGVIDKDGGQAYAYHSLIVENVPPIVELNGPDGSLRAGQSYHFQAVAYDPSPADTAKGFTFFFDWGDGSSKEIQGESSVEIAKVFEQPGRYTVSVHAEDVDGDKGEAASMNVDVIADEETGDTGVPFGGGCRCSTSPDFISLFGILVVLARLKLFAKVL